MTLNQYFREWSIAPHKELLAGAVATFALIPEVIAFSFTAGVDPVVGLYASFVIAIIIAVFGGRPAMISAAAGSVAMVAAPLVRDYGVEYLFAAGLLAGVFQFVFGIARLSGLLRYVLTPVRTGFVNALAILIFAAQFPHIVTGGPLGLAVMAFGLGIIYVVPKITEVIPSPLICVIVLTVIASAFGLDIAKVEDLGRLPDHFPVFALPQVEIGLSLLMIILLPAIAIAMVGMLESLMTATVVDEMTNTQSDHNAEARGLGVANIGASLFGGIAGCGMIGQTVSNVKYGGRGRLSTAFAGVFLLMLMLLLKPLISIVPVAALVAIMVMVSIDTFNWASIRNLRSIGYSNGFVMLLTVVVTVVTHNLAVGVAAGMIGSLLIYFVMSRIQRNA